MRTAWVFSFIWYINMRTAWVFSRTPGVFTIIILRFPVSFVLKSINISIQLCNWLFIVWVLGRFWCGNDKYYVYVIKQDQYVMYYVKYLTHVSISSSYIANTHYFIHHVLYILYKYLFMSWNSACANVYCCILYTTLNKILCYMFMLCYVML